MLFRLRKKVGNHEDVKGRVYKAGEYIESSSDLTKSFKGKFDKIEDPHEIASIKNKAKSKPDIPTKAKAAKKSKKKSKASSKPVVHPKYGTQITKEFPLASDLGLEIYDKKHWIVIIDPETKEQVNEKKIRKTDVEDYLAQYKVDVEEDETEDDDEEEVEDDDDEEEVEDDDDEEEEVDDDDDEEEE